jgi:hypothetical protein
MIIEGGTGNGYAVKVTNDNNMCTFAEQVPELSFISLNKQDGYNVISTGTNIATGSYILFFRNTDPQRNFHIHKIRAGGSIDLQWDLYANSTYVAGTGTALTPGNLAFFSGRVAICTALGNVAITTITPGKLISRYYTNAYRTTEFNIEGAPILGLNNDLSVMVTNASSTNSLSITIQGYYKDIRL